MKVAIDVTAISAGHYVQHTVRGSGTYIESLKESLKKSFPDDLYNFFTRGEKVDDDVDIVHYPYFEPFFLTVPFSVFKRSVVTIHDLIPILFPSHFPPGVKGWVAWQIQKANTKRTSHIITDSQASKTDIQRVLGIDSEKITSVYLSAKRVFQPMREEEKNGIVRKYHLPAKFILYVGDVTWNKNLPALIQAVKKTQFPLVLVGKALISQNYDAKNPWNKDRATVEREIADNPQFFRLGFIPEDDLVALYSAATVFVMPSLYEGFGLPILEAMQSGCPVVTTQEGSLPEVAGDAAYYVNPYSIDSITNGIVLVAENRDLRETLRKKGRIQAKQFSWEKTARATHAVYEKLMERA